VNIEGVALAGSHASGKASETSDVDLIILSSERGQYLRSHSWLSLFGKVETLRNETWGDVETLRATYTDGLEVEYNFAEPSWADVPVDPGTRRVVKEGFRILLDPGGKLEALVASCTE
jgi:hypothetical protein